MVVLSDGATTARQCGMVAGDEEREKSGGGDNVGDSDADTVGAVVASTIASFETCSAVSGTPCLSSGCPCTNVSNASAVCRRAMTAVRDIGTHILA